MRITAPHNKPFRLGATLAVQVVFLPNFITDLTGFDFVHFPTLETYVLTKVLVWGALPALILGSLFHLFRERENLVWFVVCVATAGVFSYAKLPLLYSIGIGVILTLAWRYTASILEDLCIPVVAGALIFLGVMAARQYWILPGPLHDVAALAFGKSSTPPTQPRLSLPRNTYLIVFDEFSANSLYQAGTIPDRFQNFKRLQQSSFVPQISTTNYDYTYQAIPAILTGQYQNPVNLLPLIRLMGQPNLFDRIAPEHVMVWGTFIRYCDSLRYKGISSYCLDLHQQYKDKGLFALLVGDAAVAFHVHIAQFPLRLLVRVLSEIAPKTNHFLSPFLSATNNLFHLGLVSHQQTYFPMEIERLQDFLNKIGSKQNTFYYYHSATPHNPFLYDRDFQMHKDFEFSRFEDTDDQGDMDQVKIQYLRSIEASDRLLGMVLDRLDAVDPTAILLVTADHGALKTFGLAPTRGQGVIHPDVAEIPFFLRLPADLKDKQPAAPAPTPAPWSQHVDIIPTLLELWGYPPDPGLPGVSLLSGAKSSFRYMSNKMLFTEYPFPHKTNQ